VKDRVTDNTVEFYARLRAISPRQRRLRAQHEMRLAKIYEARSAVLGGLMLMIIFILFSFL